MRFLTSITVALCGLLLPSCSPEPGATPGPPVSVFQMRRVQDNASPDTERMTILHSYSDGRSTRAETLNVERKVLLDHTAVRSATFQHPNPAVAPVIEVVFTEEGRTQFGDVTRENIGKRMAMVVDGKLLAAPRIEAEVSGGVAIISGAFTVEDAKELAAKLNDAVKR